MTRWPGAEDRDTRASRGHGVGSGVTLFESDWLLKLRDGRGQPLILFDATADFLRRRFGRREIRSCVVPLMRWFTKLFNSGGAS